MFKLKGVSLYYCLLCLFACQPTPEAAPEAQEKSPVAQESSLASSDATAATNLLLGRWVSVQDSDSD